MVQQKLLTNILQNWHFSISLNHHNIIYIISATRLQESTLSIPTVLTDDISYTCQFDIHGNTEQIVQNVDVFRE